MINRKVVFICGTFELAKSGVADFIFLLARELIKQRFQCACIALHDPYASEALPDSHLSWQQGELPVRRLSSRLPWSVKADVLRADIEALNPDWISLHYVPYAFHLKGLPLGMLKALGTVITTAQWQIMAHELWVDPSAGRRQALLSTLQQWIARRLFAKLRPRVVHVTNHSYQAMLAGCGIQSTILPLFSSIPFASGVSPTHHPKSTWTFVVFGAINRDWSPEPLLQRIDAARVCHGIESCCFVSVGNAGAYGELLWDSLPSQSYPAFSFSRLGELPAKGISEQLQHADFGVAVMPSVLVGKSSSVAAMVSHGLPVIISRLSENCEDWHETLQRTGRYILLDSPFAANLGSSMKYRPVDTLVDTAQQFARDLECAS